MNRKISELEKRGYFFLFFLSKKLILHLVFHINRTRKNAGEVAEIPTQLATITNPNYQNSTSLYKKGNAYLQPLVSADGLKSENGKLFFKGLPATIAMLKDSFTNTIPETLDLSFLQLCFSIILTNFNAPTTKVVGSLANSLWSKVWLKKYFYAQMADIRSWIS